MTVAVKVSKGLMKEQQEKELEQQEKAAQEAKDRMNKYIKEKQDELNKAQEELVTLLKLQAMFPDITIHHDRWGKHRFSSAMVTPIADKFYTHHSCGCCNDAALLVRAFTKIDGFTVYAEPDSVYIGEKDSYYKGGERLEDDWRERLRKAGYHPDVIAGVAEELKYCTGEPCDDDWDDDPEPIV